MEKYTTNLEDELAILRAKYNELPINSPEKESLRQTIESLEDKIREKKA